MSVRSAVTFRNAGVFQAEEAGYDLMPFRFTRIPNVPDQVLVTSAVGEYLFLSEPDFDQFTHKRLTRDSDTYRNLRSRNMVCDTERGPFFPGLGAQHRTRKLFAEDDPALHIFVVTLRCDHRCHYCQVSPRQVTDAGFDMSKETADAALDIVFQSSAPCLTIEFQGGESALAFERIRYLVEQAELRPKQVGQQVKFVIATTLHLLTDEMLVFCRDHNIELSTSLDGPAHVHDANRINPGRDAFEKTVAGIERARAICGQDRVAALVTVTSNSLPYPEEIVDTYVAHGFDSISLRPLSPFGFAVRSAPKLGYTAPEFLDFYRKALEHLIKINLSGTQIEESYATLLLNKILTPFPTSYVDLQSPSAAGSGVLVYNYDGGVYVSDEGRMLAEMGDARFCMGTVYDSLDALRASPAMRIITEAGEAEWLAGCSTCAFVPYCGADPVFHVATQGDPVGHRPTSEFCHRHTGLFQLMFGFLARRNPDVMSVFLSWISRRPLSDIPHTGYMT